MSLTDEERAILVNLEYEKGKSFLEQAEKIVELGYWDMVDWRTQGCVLQLL